MALTVPVAEIVKKTKNPLLGKHKSWKRVLLGEIATVLNGYAFKSAKFTREKGTPLIRIRDVGKDSTNTNYDSEYDKKYLVEKGDLLIGMDGDFHSGRWRGPKGLLNQRVCKVVLETEDFLISFLEYLLPGYLKAINDVTSSVTVKHLSSQSIKEIPLPSPTLNEQKRIVAEIEKQFSRLDEAVDNLKRVKSNLKRYKASVLKAAVEGKLTEEWRKEYPDVESADKLLERILTERRRKWEEVELAKMKKAGEKPKDDTWKKKYKEPPQIDALVLPELPDGWAWANLERLAEDIPYALKAGPFGSSLKKSFYVPYGYKIYGQEQVLRNDPSYGDYYIDEERYEKLKNCSVKPGDILISLVGTIGKVLILPEGIEPGIINPRLVKLSLNRRLVDENFIKTYLQSPYVKYLFSIASHGGTMDILNLTILKEIPIPVPPLEEQKDIIEEIERISSIEIELNTIIQANITRADRLRQSILKKAFSGQLVEQHNNDESDRELLGTIKTKV
jgi:type I restriction enzyme S subunit